MRLKEIGERMVEVGDLDVGKMLKNPERTEGMTFRIRYRTPRDNRRDSLEGRYGVTVRSALITREARTTLDGRSHLIRVVGEGTCMMSEQDLEPVSWEEYAVAEVMLS